VIRNSEMPNHAASTGGFVSAGAAAGKVKWNVAPRPPLLLAQIRPPCDSTIDLLIAKPMPLPCGGTQRSLRSAIESAPY